MKREDEIRQYCLEQGFPQGACSSILEVKAIVATEAIKWADKTMIEKACKCYCDDICDKGRCCICFHKHDGKGQVKNDFQYNECNELKLIRKAMEE